MLYVICYMLYVICYMLYVIYFLVSFIQSVLYVYFSQKQLPENIARALYNN